MNNNLEFENEDPSPNDFENNHPRTNYGEGYSEKETLEEFIEEELEGYDEIDFSTYERFIKLGAKWQQERMYSEEELLSAFEAGKMFIGEDKGSFREWFEQFKKK
jgi:hypothetical protein